MDELCKDQPEEIKLYMQYCRGLGFIEEPKYDYIMGLFHQCMKKNGIDKENPEFVWISNHETDKTKLFDKSK